MAEADPLGKAPQEPGAKLDAGKAPIIRGVVQYFPRALEAVSLVSLAGAKKYAWKGWEHVPDGVVRYSDALGRHLIKEETEGPIDQETGCLHAAQIAWNALARLELMLRDRQTVDGSGASSNYLHSSRGQGTLNGGSAGEGSAQQLPQDTKGVV